jgi:hypothetical protein
MFAEDVILAALKGQAWWFVSDHLLTQEKKR